MPWSLGRYNSRADDRFHELEERIMRTAFLAAQVLILVASAAAVSAQQAAPCRDDGRYAALDFWVGEWRVVDRQGETVGTNRIEKRQAGCLIEESWTSARGGGGQSMNYLDPATGLWKQHWVDQRGTVVHYTGTVDGGVLLYEGQHIRADGTVRMARVRLEPLAEGRLHHLIEHSTDGGETWTTYFDATYLPVGGQVATAQRPPEVAAPEPEAPVPSPSPAEPAPSEPAPSEPAPSDQAPSEPAASAAAPPAAPQPQEQASRQADREGSEVSAVSRVLGREEIPEEQAPELRMASPMVLEIEPGPIDRLPENTAWSTDETKGFMVNDIVVRKVMMARRGRGEEVELEVGVHLFTSKRIRRADLLLEVLLGDRVVASEELTNVRVGLNIPAHGKEGLLITAELGLPRQEFEQLFAEGADRKLRLTVSSP